MIISGRQKRQTWFNGDEFSTSNGIRGEPDSVGEPVVKERVISGVFTIVDRLEDAKTIVHYYDKRHRVKEAGPDDLLQSEQTTKLHRKISIS